MRFKYINNNIPEIDIPECRGKYYEAVVPDTLDLAERASLSVNILTEALDPKYDYEIYWIIDLLAKEPIMYHTPDYIVETKFFQSLPLVRNASGSRQNLDIEEFLMKKYLHMQGEDGLFYYPIKGKPWALPSEPVVWAGLDYLPSGEYWAPLMMQGRILGGLCAYAGKYPDGPWKDAANRLVEGLKRVTIFEDDIAYLFLNCTEPGKEVIKPEKRPVGFRAAINGWLSQGLVQTYRYMGNTDALSLALKLMTYVMRDSGYFGLDGRFNEEFPGMTGKEKFTGDSIVIHFHAHTTQIVAALDVVLATGDEELLESALKAYEYAVSQGSRTLGFFPELLTYRGGNYGEGPCSSEICEVADMIASAVKLSLLGIDRWDDVDKWTRNQFAECQLTDTNWLTDGHMELIDRDMAALPFAGSETPKYGTTERVLERAIGSFSGWPAANDFVQGKGWSVMHCCTGNATRVVYYVWENIINYDNGILKVNLLMNRASKWADIDSHIPFNGRVDIKVKKDIRLMLRLPGWVDAQKASCIVNDRIINSTMDGRYLKAEKLKKGDRVTLEFPIPEKTEDIIVEKHKYRVTLRGNDVVYIDPPGKNKPIYQKDHYRKGRTLWKKIIRFVPELDLKGF